MVQGRDSHRDYGLLNYESLEVWAPWGYSNEQQKEQNKLSYFSKISGLLMANRASGLQYMPTQLLVGDAAWEDGMLKQAVAATNEYYGQFDYPQAIQVPISAVTSAY